MADRRIVQFADLFEAPLRNGLTKPKAVRGEGVKMVNMAEVFAYRRIHSLAMDRVPMDSKERDSSLLRAGDLLFARQSLVLSGAGKCVMFQGDNEEVTFESHIIRCRLDQRKADPAFYFYFFQSFLGRSLIESIVEQVAAAGIRGSDLGRLAVPIPSLDEQKAIAAVLGALDDKIELNRRMNATLEAMARALFQSWFVDFDPVRAKLDGREPVGLDPATAALFSSHFDHKAEGVVPTGWSLKRWGDIATLEYGKSIRDYRESSGKYRVFGTNGPIGFHEETLCNSAGIVIGRKGAYRGVHYSPEPFFVIDTAFYLKPKAAVDLKWAYYELLRFDINSMDSGSAIPSTSRDDFYGIPVIVPPPEIQAAFGEIVEGWFRRMFANNYESGVLVTLRDTLLPKLLGGELSVAEIH
jgi:type I restriction enzyme S subunit